MFSNHTPNSFTNLPIITYSEVEQYVRDWISTGSSEYLYQVPKNELLAHCWMVGIEKSLIKKAYLQHGCDELVKALMTSCPFVGSSSAITEDLQTFLNRSHDLYCIIHSRGRLNSIGSVSRQLMKRGPEENITEHQFEEDGK